MVRVIAAMIVENEELRIKLALQSILKWIDKVYIVYSPSKDNTLQEILSLNDDRIEIIVSQYDHDSLGANGKQRNVYLEKIKERELNSWCIVLDSDEVMSDDAFRIKGFIPDQPVGPDCYNPKMRHLIRTLGWEDATREKHFVPCRLFRVSEDLHYDEVEHPILSGWKQHGGDFDYDWFTIWHVSSMIDVYVEHKKFLNHVNKSNIHNKEFLNNWISLHLLGQYPVKQVNPNDLPTPIKRRFATV